MHGLVPYRYDDPQRVLEVPPLAAVDQLNRLKKNNFKRDRNPLVLNIYKVFLLSSLIFNSKKV